jgi:hypothetical protein
MPAASKDPTDVISGAILNRLPEILSPLLKRVNIEELAVNSGTIGNISIDKVNIGIAKIDKVTLANTVATVKAGSVFLQNVRMNLELQFHLDWWYDLWIASDSGTSDLGSMWFSMSIGNVAVPALQDIHMNIPSVEIHNVTGSIPPINSLKLGDAGFTSLVAKKTTLPVTGFSLSGLGMGVFSLSSAQVPQTFTDEASIASFTPSAEIALPGFTMTALNVPQTSIPNVTSDQFTLDARAGDRSIGVDAGIFGVTIRVTPIAHMAIGAMVMSNLSMSASVGSVVATDIRVPVNVKGIVLDNLTMTDIGVKNITG